MIIKMGRPFANDHPDGPVFRKWSFGWAGLLQMIIRISRPFAIDHKNGPPFCKWSPGWAGLLQMIIWMGKPFANHHMDGLAFCKWSYRLAGLLQMIIQISSFQPDFFFFFSKSEDQASISWTFIEQCLLGDKKLSWNVQLLKLISLPISGKYGLRNHFWPLESRFLMRKKQKKSIFSKPPNLPILSFWILNVLIIICQFQKRSTMIHFFSLSTCSCH